MHLSDEPKKTFNFFWGSVTSVMSVMSVMSVKLNFNSPFFELTYIYNKNNII